MSLESVWQSHFNYILSSLDKLQHSVYVAAVQCTRNDALADRSVTQMELQLLSLREEKERLEKRHYQVESQQLENEAYWTENWNKMENLEKELTEKTKENRQLENKVQDQQKELDQLQQDWKEKDQENRQLEQTVRSLMEQVNQLSSWKVQSRTEFHDTLWGNRRLTEELKEANKVIERQEREKEQLVQEKASLWEKMSELETKWQLQTKEWEGREKQLREELERSKTTEQEMSHRLQEKQQHISHLERKVQEANQNIESLKEKSKREKEELQRLYQSFFEQSKETYSYHTISEEDERRSQVKDSPNRRASLKRPRYAEDQGEHEEDTDPVDLHTQDLLQSVLHELEEHAPQLEIQRKELERAVQSERQLIMQLEKLRIEVDKLRSNNKYLEEQRIILEAQIQELKEKKQSLERRMLIALREKDMNSQETLDSNLQGLVQRLDWLAEETDEKSRVVNSSTPLTVSRSLFQTPYSVRNSIKSRGKVTSSFKSLAQEVKELLRRQETLITTLIQQKDLYKSLVEEEILQQKSGC
ncbi:hypothetical protein GpartN1_g5588.t1 [Galdieria partita]|uniref:Uncharacterized protein n=1 Tax=Galdieria partita TaxID=83374 RepID=A0A9C7Q254_9RHOD|nr:hypothetical protein GpartN1_g5588.t1 [Galdieria partita]